MDIVAFVVAMVAIGTLGVAFWQVKLQTEAIRLQTASMKEDRDERRSQREQRRAAIFAALKSELEEIQTTARADYEEYRGEVRQSERISQEGDSRSNEGELRHQLGFPWSRLPDDTIAQAISEAALLGLTPEQIKQLQTLHGRIRRVNTLAGYKVGLYPSLMEADIPRGLTVQQLYGSRPWVEGRAAQLNNALSANVYAIIGKCEEILGSWHFE